MGDKIKVCLPLGSLLHKYLQNATPSPHEEITAFYKGKKGVKKGLVLGFWVFKA